MRKIRGLATDWFDQEYGPMHANGYGISTKAFEAGFKMALEMAKDETGGDCYCEDRLIELEKELEEE
jgi:hypothetical protein